MCESLSLIIYKYYYILNIIICIYYKNQGTRRLKPFFNVSAYLASCICFSLFAISLSCATIMWFFISMNSCLAIMANFCSIIIFCFCSIIIFCFRIMASFDWSSGLKWPLWNWVWSFSVYLTCTEHHGFSTEPSLMWKDVCYDILNLVNRYRKRVVDTLYTQWLSNTDLTLWVLWWLIFWNIANKLSFRIGIEALTF